MNFWFFIMCIHKNINWVDAVADIFIKLTNLFGWTLPWRMSTENLYVNLKGSNANYVWYSPGHCQGDYHGDISAHWQIRPRARTILLTLIVVGSARTIDFPHQHYSVPTPMSQSYEQLENDFCFSIFPFNINQLIGSSGGDGWSLIINISFSLRTSARLLLIPLVMLFV